MEWWMEWMGGWMVNKQRERANYGIIESTSTGEKFEYL